MNKEYQKIKDQYEKLAKQLQDPGIVSNTQKFKKISQEYAEHKDVYELITRLESIDKGIKEAQASLKNKELKELAEQELESLGQEKDKIENQIKEFLKPTK